MTRAAGPALARMAITTRVALLLLLLVPSTPGAAGQASPTTPTPPAGEAGGFQVGDVAVRLERDNETLEQLKARTTVDTVETGTSTKLAAEEDAIEHLDNSTRVVLDGTPALVDLQELERQWTESATRLTQWSGTLAARVKTMQRDVGQAHDLRVAWAATVKQFEAKGAPPALLEQARATLAEATTVEERSQERLSALLDLQARLVEDAARVDTLLTKIRRTRGDIMGQLLVRESPTLFGAWRTATGHGVATRLEAALRAEGDGIRTYLGRRSALIPTWLTLLAAALLAARGVRRWSRHWEGGDAATRDAMRLFERPFSVALVVWLILTPLPYGGTPRLIMRFAAVIFLLPVLRVASALVDEALRSRLYWLLGLIALDVIRGPLEAAPTIERTVLAAECAIGALALLWWPSTRGAPAAAPPADTPARPLLDLGRRAAILFLVVAFAANLLGLARLALLLYSGTVYGIFAGVVAFTLAHVFEGLVVLALHTRLAGMLHMVQRYREVIIRRAHRLIRGGMMVLWGIWILRAFSVLNQAVAVLRTVLGARLPVGQISLSLGDLVAFAIALWVAFLIARLLRVILEDEFFPRMHLGRGVPYAVATFSSYTVLLVGFFIALGAAGIGFDRLAVVAGALGVGVGFGLQTIVNNFVSGLILLFERPIQIGDVVQLGDVMGTVRHIGLRSSMIHTYEGAEIIVPNANLIAQQVVNWTLSDRKRRVDLAVGVAYGTDPQRVLTLLVEVAKQQPDVLDDPEPVAFFMGFGDSALNFELRAWTGNLEERLHTRSALAVAVNQALGEAGIEIPFPQRDLHIRGVDPALALPAPTPRQRLR